MSRGTWKVLAESEVGTSHEESGVPCQDASFYSPVQLADGNTYLVAAVADGAGSAARSGDGARATVRSLVGTIIDALVQGASADEDLVTAGFHSARESLEALAAVERLSIDDLACTALVSVVGPDCSLHGQIGDGVIVLGDGDRAVRAISGKRSEYLNETDFLSGSAFESNLRLATSDACEWFALMTDGLEGLAVNYSDDAPLARFFRPFVDALCRCQDPSELVVELRGFLGSPGVNNRTDDDKTLLVAVRGGGEALG